ncbi:MAG: helix-turn-helix domain-containing protein [Candidatus Wenzhouxiangella sp. M2_3B_020]
MKQPDDRDNPNAPDQPGARLRNARQRQDLQVTEAARRLNLPRTTVEDIEAGRLDRIAPIYRRGYIANYARLVGLDPEPLLEELGSDQPAPLRSVLPVQPRGQRFDRFLKFATYALVTTVIVPPLVYFFVLGGARLFEGELTARPADGEPSSVSEEDAAGYRERFADVLSVQPATLGEPDEQPLSASALPVPVRRPMDPAREETAAGRDGETGGESAGEEGNGTAMLEIALADDSWVEIEGADGERLEFDLLRAGQRRAYEGRPPFRLLLGRGSAVSVSLDGHPVRFDGDDEAGVAEFLLSDPDAAGRAVQDGPGDAAEPGPASG